MDVNGTRFHLLLGRADWAGCTDEHGVTLDLAGDGASPPQSVPAQTSVAWDSTRQELTLTPIPFRFPAGQTDRPPQLSDRRGAGRDSFGNWYWIDPPARGLLVQSAGTGRTSSFWPGAEEPPAARFGAFGAVAPAPPPLPLALSGAAVTEDNFLVVGCLAPPGLLAFDLQTGDPPVRLPWPADSDFAPFDLSARPGGGVFVLTREPGPGASGQHRVWELDRHLHVRSGASAASSGSRPGDFGPSAASPPNAPPPPTRKLGVADATPVAGDVIAIEAHPDGGFLTLDRGDAGGSQISRYRDGAQLGAAVPTPGVTGYDLALVGDRLMVVDAGGNQSHAFTLSGPDGAPALELLPSFYPMRRFGGKGLVAAGGAAYYDLADRWIPLVSQARPQHVEQATVITPVLDSRTPACIWHRMMLDARIGHGTRVAVASRAADDAGGLASLDWLAEPDPRPRRMGSEVPFVDDGPYDTHELLLQRARGRYLQVRLVLLGDGRGTPRIRALRVWYPRFSYLGRYLPGVYRQDPESASFLDRYLANVEGFYTAIEDRIAAAQVFLKADTAPNDALDWLAGWFAATLDPLWEEHRRRVFLRNASRFFAARGTIRGVELALRFALDPGIDDGAFDQPRSPALATARIVEAYRTRAVPGVVFGDPSDQGFPRIVTPLPKWTPVQGGGALEAGWAAYLEQNGADGPVAYPVADPGGSVSALWAAFSRAVLGFLPTLPDQTAWGLFLSRRYASSSALASAYALAAATAPPDITAIEPPTSVPPDGPPLRDWFDFQAIVVPTKSKAHRFAVLLPWPLHVRDGHGDELSSQQLRDLATRIVELQKPAQTTFSVKFFWAAFRVGDARLGDDTLLASGSRVPELVNQAVLGGTYLGETFLGGAVAGDSIRRAVSPLPAGPDKAQELP